MQMVNNESNNEKKFSEASNYSGKMPEGFNIERSDRYADATKKVPNARERETLKVTAALDDLARKDYQAVLEIGVGQGFGTSALLNYLAEDGMIYGIDSSEYMASHISSNPKVKLHIGALDEFSLQDDSIDFAFSLAAFHHIPNKYLVLKEMLRIMKPGAKCLIVDVNHGTEAQETFDYIVRKHCVSGHDADFLDSDWVSMLAKRTGFVHLSSSIEETNWLFSTEEEMIDYVNDLFALEDDLSHVKTLVDGYLKPYRENNGIWAMPWSLGFHLLQK